VRLNILFFAFGAWLLQRQAALPEFRWAFLLGAALVLPVLSHLPGICARIGREILLQALCLGFGFFWAAALAQNRLADKLPAAWEGRDIQVVGAIASMPQSYERSVRFGFDVERVLTAGATVPRHIALSWWGTAADDPKLSTLPELHPGERWQLTVRLKRPHGTVNPHGFDYEAWLLERNIRATGYVRPKNSRRLAAMAGRPQYLVESARDMLRERILKALPDRPYAGVLAALAIGDQRAIPPEQWQIFTRTGVNHLMSISGLHVTMVSGLALAIAYWLWRRSMRLTLWLPARKAAVLFAFAAAVVYALLAGFGVPAQRTLYMIAVMALALWSGRMGSPSVVLALALLAVVLRDPWAVLAPGFWLSFGAVAVILFVTAGRVVRPGWFRAWARVQWAVTLGLIPPLLAMFQQVSVVSPFANAVAIPVVSLAVVPLTLAGMLLPFDFVLLTAHEVMAWCMALLDWMSTFPAAVWQQHAPPAWTVVIAALGAAWLLLPRGFPARGLGVIGFLPLFLVLPPKLEQGALKLTVLDVGQGLAVVAQTRNHALLYDAGPAFGPGADSGNRIIVPYLRAVGVRGLESMILSHGNADHSGGAASVFQALPVGALYASVPDTDPLLLEAERTFRCYAGQDWEWDGVRFEMLHPSRASYDRNRIKNNNRSCVLRIVTLAGNVLLPGDIQRKAEDELMLAQSGALHADVLVAPHHGSKTSSTPEFVRDVGPRTVIFPVGYRNRFGHPHKEAVQRYRDLGSSIYRTDRDGALTVTFETSGSIRIEPYRAVHRRYWQTAMTDDKVADIGKLFTLINKNR
jgi:competence protein ComEC